SGSSARPPERGLRSRPGGPIARATSRLLSFCPRRRGRVRAFTDLGNSRPLAREIPGASSGCAGARARGLRVRLGRKAHAGRRRLDAVWLRRRSPQRGPRGHGHHGRERRPSVGARVPNLSSGAAAESRGWPVRVTLLPQREKLGTSLNFSRALVLLGTGGYVG